MTFPPDMDPPCVNVCSALNELDGVETHESCSGHGSESFNVWLYVDTTKSGARVLSRCLSGRYYNYAPGELRADPQWRLWLGDTEGPPIFRLEGKSMGSSDGPHPPAEMLAKNLRAYNHTLSSVSGRETRAQGYIDNAHDKRIKASSRIEMVDENDPTRFVARPERGPSPLALAVVDAWKNLSTAQCEAHPEAKPPSAPHANDDDGMFGFDTGMATASRGDC